jgi:RNA polymerase sigma factor (sigma-70 family)
MPHEPLRLLLHRLRGLTGSVEGGLTDAELLERFVARRDEAAFEVLLWRHGPMVLGVCRRLLRRDHDVEDAFQATFLALARKAGSIGRREALAGWLYQVAYRVGLTARAVAVKRAARERPWYDLPGADLPDAVADNDLRAVLDEEVRRLPARYRLPFVLCHLQGLTNEEAAQQLGCPTGTVLSRLARARQRLRYCLTRRGVTLSAGALVVAAGEGLAAEVSADLVGKTLHTVLIVAAGKTAAVAVPVVTLTRGVLRAMLLSRLQNALVAVLALAAVGAGVGALGTWLGHGHALAAEEVPGPQAGPAAGGDNEPAAAENDPVKRAARLAQAQRNLKIIGLALHNYHDTYTHLPPPAIYGKDGKARLSWRVALLPFIEQDNLYRRFKLDEAWDSPHNKALLAEMPETYAATGAPHREPGMTYTQALVGPGAAFEPSRKLRMVDVTDGTSNTIAIVEAAAPVPWTKPEDLPFVPEQALPRLGGVFQGDFNVLFLDGSVRSIGRDLDANVLRSLITRSGGEVINFNQIPGAAPAGAPGGIPDVKRLTAENAGLKLALKAGEQELRKLRAELEVMQAQVQLGVRQLDPKALQLMRENEELIGKLGQLLQEVDQLKATKQQLAKELEKRLKEK